MLSNVWRRKNLLHWVIRYSPRFDSVVESILQPSRLELATSSIQSLGSFLCELTHLQELLLSSLIFPIMRLVPVLDASFMGRLFHLRFLSVSGWYGGTAPLMQALEQLPVLETLDLTLCPGSTFVSPNLPSLHTLWLSSSSPSAASYDNMALLPSLTSLDLSLLIVSSGRLKALSKSKTLKTLNLSFSKFSADDVAHLTSLHTLHLQSAKQYHIADFHKFTNLRELEIDRPTSPTDKQAILDLQNAKSELKIIEK